MPGFGKRKTVSVRKNNRQVKSTHSIGTVSSNNIQQLWNQYSQSALAIRGTDGQEPVSQQSIRNYIQSSSFGDNVSNPWNNFSSAMGPSFSASLLSEQAKYPILWYVYAFVDPFAVNNGATPPLQSRNQGAFTLAKFKFSGASLWDGNSNSDITASTSIPGTLNNAGNRGTSVNGYSAQLPFTQRNPAVPGCKIPVGTASFNCPTSNNTNKAYNPTFNAQNDGNPVDDANRDTIMRNICTVKGEIWDKFIPDPVNDPCGTKTNLSTNLLQNWGSGFEIEAYVYPNTYKPTGSMWLDGASQEAELESSRFAMNDVYSINIASDSKDYDNWVAQHPDPESVKNAYRKIYNDSITGAGNPDAQWINQPVGSVKLPLTLITGVMLPAVQLTGAGGQTSVEFCNYLQNGYGPLTSQNFYQLGWYTPNNDQVELFDVPVQARQ